MAKSSGGLSRWFKEEWVDISRPKKGGGFEPCGRSDADEGKYPKCVPKAKAMKMTQAEIDSAVRRKRRAESTEERKGKKPINVPTEVEKKSKNIPTNPKLYAKVKAEAKRKFDVYPSAYANGWLVQEYKRRGGGYKTVTKQQPDSSEVHVPSTNWKAKRKKKRGLSSLVRRTSYLPPELADRYVQLSREELEYLRSLGDFQQTLFGPEQKVGGLDERLLGFGYRSKAGFVIDVDDSWKTGLDEFGVKFVEDRWGDTTLDFSEASPEQIRALVSTVFDTDILSPDGKTLYQVRTKTAGENYDGSVAAGCDIYQVDVATGERKHLRATIDRTLDFNTSEVSNNVFRLPREAQGKGIGTTLLAHWEDQQSALGLMYASVHAVSGRDSNGGYTWLKTGYEPNDPRAVASTVGGDFWADHIMYDMGLSDEIRSSVRDDYIAIIQSSIESELPDLSPRGAREFAEQLADQAVDAIQQQTSDNIYSAYASARDSTYDADACLTVGRRIQDELYYANEAFISSYDNTGTYTDDEGVDHYFPGDSVTVDVNIYGYASSLQDEWKQVLKDSADWYGSKELESLGPAKRNDAILMRRDAIDADGDGIIFEGTEFERRIGTPKPVEKAMSGPSKPKSLGELFRWWADNDPAAWENDTPEVQASYQRFLSPKEPKLKKHAEHDQKSHGSWAQGQGVSNPKPYAGRGKSIEGGDPPRPLPEVGDRIGIHLDLGGQESGLGKAVAFSIKMVGEGGTPKYGTTQAHTTGVRLSDVSSHVSRKGLEDAIKQGQKNPHAAFTGKVEEWTTDRKIPKGAVEIDYWVDSKSKNADGSPKYTPETTGFWYVKDGTYRDFIGASDAVGIGGIKGEDRARTYAYGDVELGEVNPHVKEWAESRKLDKAHRLIHESRTRLRPFELAKHGDHDQLTHGNWAKGRVSSGKGIPVPEGYVALSLAERNYLARLPELRQGTLMRPLFMRDEPTSSQETPRLGEKLVSVDPSDFATVYETRAGMVIDSAEPEYFDEYDDADKMATDIFNLGLVTDDGRTLAVEAQGIPRGNGVTSVSLTIKDIETGENLGMADRVLNDDP
jgi:GNAT superfamily N-acetyltransferase